MRPASFELAQPTSLGEAEVGCALDVFWGMNKDQGRTVPMLAFSIESGPDPILVDAGMRSAERAMNIHRLVPHRQPVGMSLPDQLAKFGVEAVEVKTLSLPHLDYDQWGGCELLPNAQIIVQRSELAAAVAPMGPRTLENGSREPCDDRQDVAAMFETLWDRVEFIEGDTKLFAGIECVLYPNSHTPGSQCVYIDSMDGVIGCMGDLVCKVDPNGRKAIPPGIYYGLEEMQRALRGDIIYPAHDPMVLEPDLKKRFAALSPPKPWP